MHHRTHRLTPASRFLLAAFVAGFVTLAVPAWGQVIHEDFKILADDGQGGDQFGYSIAIDNGVIAVGAYRDDDNGTNSGSAYVFDAATGVRIEKLLPSDNAEGDWFGYSIAIDNDVVAVGASRDHDNGLNSGSAYVFNAYAGTQIAKLLASDGAWGERFGWSIAIDNGVVVVGVPQDTNYGTTTGSAYVFDASSGVQIAKLIPNDGASRGHFGHSIAIENDIVAVGAVFDDDNGQLSGSAYLFDAFTGAQIVKFLPSDGEQGDQFGFSIAIDNSVVAVGAQLDDDNGLYSGSAYLFDISDPTNPTEIAKLLPSDGVTFAQFGYSIAIDNGVAAVGAWYHGGSGSAYLFDVSTGAQIAKLLPSDIAEGDSFGVSVAIEDGIVAVGANDDDDNGLYSGSAYVFDVNSILNCLTLTVDNLVAGEQAVFTIKGGAPDAKVVTVYGISSGETSVNDYAGYCATFDIAGVTEGNVIGGFNRTFDANGEITFTLDVPNNLAGRRLFFQSAQHGTCPDECMSNLVEAVVQ